MKISVIGTGKTGSSIVELLGADAVPFNSTHPPTAENLSKTDAAIIFVPADAAGEISEVLIKSGIPAVWGTTGYAWPETLPDKVKSAGAQWVIGSNFSMGMNLIRKAIRILGSGSSLLSDAEFHIHEVHHTGKKDAPSGTALSWKEWLGQDAHISSDRQGDVKGIHSLHIKTKYESITLKHEAHSRKLFAEGAVWTAKYLLDHPYIDPGVYTFASIFDKAYRGLIQ
jgi:4-hydroxy-tetrahydrodipicolinate reductase